MSDFLFTPAVTLVASLLNISIAAIAIVEAFVAIKILDQQQRQGNLLYRTVVEVRANASNKALGTLCGTFIGAIDRRFECLDLAKQPVELNNLPLHDAMLSRDGRTPLLHYGKQNADHDCCQKGRKNPCLQTNTVQLFAKLIGYFISLSGSNDSIRSGGTDGYINLQQRLLERPVCLVLFVARVGKLGSDASVEGFDQRV